MRIGILADIHGHTSNLERAVECLKRENVERFVALGDTIYDHRNVSKTVAILQNVEAIGVWGNHELGFCVDPTVELRKQFNNNVNRFFDAFVPRFELGEILFSHTFPSQDASDPLAYYLGPELTDKNSVDECFVQFPQRVMIIGHFHRWFAATAAGEFEWNGVDPIHLRLGERYFFVINAVKDGQAAIFDQDTNSLIPVHF